jgi:hypothetical protein
VDFFPPRQERPARRNFHRGVVFRPARADVNRRVWIKMLEKSMRFRFRVHIRSNKLFFSLFKIYFIWQFSPTDSVPTAGRIVAMSHPVATIFKIIHFQIFHKNYIPLFHL